MNIKLIRNAVFGYRCNKFSIIGTLAYNNLVHLIYDKERIVYREYIRRYDKTIISVVRYE